MKKSKPFNAKKYRSLLAEEAMENSERVTSLDGKKERAMDDHQEEAMTETAYALANKKDRFSVVHCCSAGKTTLAAGLLKASHDVKEGLNGKLRNTQDVFITPRRDLIEQTRKLLVEFLGLDVGVWGDGKRVLDRPVLLVTLQALKLKKNRENLHKLINPQNVSLLIGDEADTILTKLGGDVLDQFSNATRLGLTATPQWRDGRHINECWGEIIHEVSLPEGIRSGICVPPMISIYQSNFSVGDIAIAKIEKEDDFERKSLEAALKLFQIEEAVPNIYESVVSEEKAKRFPTLVYVPTVGLVRSITAKFKERYPNLNITSWTGKIANGRRRKQQKDFLAGKVDVLVLCEMGGRGLDLPNARCIIDAYPTLSPTKLIQRHGRGLRQVRIGTAIHSRGFKKSFAHLIQIIPQANTFRPVVIPDILDCWEEYEEDSERVIDFKTDKERRAERRRKGGGNGVDYDEVREVRAHMAKYPVRGSVERVSKTDALKEMLQREDIPQVCADGFFYLNEETGDAMSPEEHSEHYPDYMDQFQSLDQDASVDGV